MNKQPNKTMKKTTNSNKCLLIALAIGISIAPLVYADCNNMVASTQSRDFCSNCDTGAGQNNGGACSYQITTMDVFCNCGTGKDCHNSAHDTWLLLQNFHGTCYNGACVNAVFIENNAGDMVTKYSTDCGA